ncbi:MAG: hypothetical protein M1813_002491 [Trichoglossum hirsutum]|nr:MAG: hypothetical protein M1813_002491 [Trichoglossum hirsutum]
MNPTLVTTVPSTVRPRNKRLTSAINGDVSSGGAPNSRPTSPQASPASSRAASPIPNRHPSRTASKRTVQSLDTSNNGQPLGGLSLGGTQTPVAFASGLWENSWSTLQGLASTVLGSDALENQKDKPQMLKRPHQQRKRFLGDTVPQRKRAVSATPRSPTKWGPPGASSNVGDLIGIGSTESREALVRSKRREELLMNGDSSRDLSGRYKRRTSDDIRPASFSVPPDHERGEPERDALVYVHQVRPNDTLAGVVIQFGCQMSVFRRANRLWPNDTIQSRKTVVLPVDACSVKGRPMPESTVDVLGEYDSSHRRDYAGNSVTSWGMPSLPFPQTQDKQSGAAPMPPAHEYHEDPPWKHESWVEIDGIPGTVEIARLPRKSLGFFPSSRRKSVSYSDLDTPSASVDLPRRTGSPSQGRSRSGSYITNRMLHGPGGVGTLGADVYTPGPAEDGLNKYIATHLPSVLPHSSFESSSKVSGLENVGNAIEGWVRKIATRATAIVETAPKVDSSAGGDLIELTGGLELGDDEVQGDSGGTTGRQGLDGSLRDRRRGRSREGVDPKEK